jgi:hypothetical protein
MFLTNVFGKKVFDKDVLKNVLDVNVFAKKFFGTNVQTNVFDKCFEQKCFLQMLTKVFFNECFQQ